MSQHTPTPWKTVHSAAGYKTYIENEDGLIGMAKTRDFLKDEANAEFIVRAVNDYEKNISEIQYLKTNLEIHLGAREENRLMRNKVQVLLEAGNELKRLAKLYPVPVVSERAIKNWEEAIAQDEARP